jgi:3-deoxy-D-manno-octulosonic-acid transferase
VPVLVCGSTAEYEDQILIAAHQTALQSSLQLITILAPRHPERFNDVAALLPDPALRRSTWAGNPTPIPPGSIFLLDSIGELAGVYALASLAFAGGSLLPPGGGQNPLEPARFGVAIIAGEYMQNFRDITAALQESGALTRVTTENLASALTLAQLPTGQWRGQRGLAVVQANRGATERTLAELLSLLEARP